MSNWRLIGPIAGLIQLGLLVWIYEGIYGPPDWSYLIALAIGGFIIYYLGYSHGMIQESRKATDAFRRQVALETITISLMKAAEETLAPHDLSRLKEATGENLQSIDLEEELADLGVTNEEGEEINA